MVTCGAAGSVASDGKTMARTDARPVEVVDTLGAGDTFIAGFLAARLAGQEPAWRALRPAGTWPPLPAVISADFRKRLVC